MKRLRIIIGILFFISLMVGAIPTQAKTDKTTGLRVVKPYLFPPAEVSALAVAFPNNIPEVDPDKMRIRARLDLTTNLAYQATVEVVNAQGIPIQALYVFFNNGDFGSGDASLKGRIGLDGSDPLSTIPPMIFDVPNSGKADVRVLSTGLPPGEILKIRVTLAGEDLPQPLIQTGFVKTSTK